MAVMSKAMSARTVSLVDSPGDRPLASPGRPLRMHGRTGPSGVESPGQTYRVGDRSSVLPPEVRQRCPILRDEGLPHPVAFSNGVHVPSRFRPNRGCACNRSIRSLRYRGQSAPVTISIARLVSGEGLSVPLQSTVSILRSQTGNLLVGRCRSHGAATTLRSPRHFSIDRVSRLSAGAPRETVRGWPGS